MGGWQLNTVLRSSANMSISHDFHNSPPDVRSIFERKAASQEVTIIRSERGGGRRGGTAESTGRVSATAVEVVVSVATVDDGKYADKGEDDEDDYN